MTLLTFQPANKFATHAVTFHCLTSAKQTNRSLLRLLAHLLRRQTASWATPQDFEQHLASLYNADWRIQNRELGGLNDFQLTCYYVVPSMTDEPTMLRAVMALFQDTWDNRLSSTSENQTLLAWAQKTALNDLRMLEEDGELSALRLTQATLYSENSGLHQLPLGDETQLKQATLDQVRHTWRMLQTSAVVVGTLVTNCPSGLVREILAPFTHRLPDASSAQIQALQQQLHVPYDSFSQVAKVKKEQTREQTRLVLAYQLNQPTYRKLSDTLVLLNRVWGGDDQSRLFQHVREQSGWAYDIQSDYDPYLGTLTVSVGTETHQVAAVKQAVQKELYCLQQQAISLNELRIKQQSLIESRQLSVDSLSVMLQRYFLQEFVPDFWRDDATFSHDILDCTPAMIQAAAQLLELRAEILVTSITNEQEGGTD